MIGSRCVDYSSEQLAMSVSSSVGMESEDLSILLAVGICSVVSTVCYCPSSITYNYKIGVTINSIEVAGKHTCG